MMCCYQMAAALRHLHQHGMVHLDVKPDNIYMSLDSGSYKLGDFGLVTKSNGQGRVMEGDGRYLPQEMLNGDHRSLEKVGPNVVHLLF
jgi:wee1-like protein kinase